jgi:hypothetical protein
MSWQRQKNLVCDMAYDYPYRRSQQPRGNAGMQTLGMVVVCGQEKLLTPAERGCKYYGAHKLLASYSFRSRPDLARPSTMVSMITVFPQAVS